MADPLSTNIGFALPIRGSDVGTWDVPVNGNSNILDALFGGITVQTVGSTNVTLLTSQAQVSILRFTGTLTAAANIMIPSVIKFWTIENMTTGAFPLTISTTAAGGQVIGLPPGEAIESYSDGTNIKYRNLSRVGTYWDYAGSSVPNWVSACTVPPYLQCNGGSVSSATYPVLFGMIGATLPDARSRVRMALDQGAARVSSDAAGFNGNTLFAAGGSQFVASHLHINVLNDPGHSHQYATTTINYAGGAGGAASPAAVTGTTALSYTGMSITNGTYGLGASQNVQPTYVGGLTFIRAA